MENEAPMKNTIELNQNESYALGEVLEFMLGEMEQGVDDRYEMIEGILDQVDALKWR